MTSFFLNARSREPALEERVARFSQSEIHGRIGGMTRHISKDFTAGTERYGAGSALPETARFRFDTSDSSLIIDRWPSDHPSSFSP